ncbi:hypothetical protein [Lachnoclostridium sp. An118]|uniref:hypothetical protein n=1 Tax=Lachnoclostridium sp. An118 TaxID=1965547 RepID=UPI0009782FEE|nr:MULTISPECIES: hypothetical protein [Lachnoclostridium]OUQ49892.1 hypothetical protein B5E62_09460 [Lachnoclostridium sp. An118]
MKYQEVIRLVALSRLKSKKTGDVLYRVSLKKSNPDGLPRTAEFWLDKSIGEECIRLGLTEDVDVRVVTGFDEFLRLAIVQILPADLDEELDLN